MKQFAKQLHDSLEGAYPEPGKTYAQIEEEQQRAAEEAKRKAEQAAREAEQAAREAAQRAQEAFREQFTAPIFKAISTGDWMSAAQAIKEFAQNREGFIQMASSLSDANGQRIDAIEVMGLITGAYRELLSQLDAQIQLMQWAGEDASALKELKQNIEDLFDPLGALRGALRDIIAGAATDPASAANKLRELAQSFKIGSDEWNGVIAQADEYISTTEQLISKAEEFGIVTDGLTANLEEFKAALAGTTVQMVRWKKWIGETKYGGLIDALISPLSEGAQSAMRDFLLALDPSALDEAVSGFADLLGTSGAKIANSLLGIGTNLASGNVLGAVLSLTNLFSALLGVQANYWKGVIDDVQTAFERLSKTAKKLRQTFEGLISKSEAYKSVQSGISDLVQAFRDALGAFLWPLAAIIEQFLKFLGIAKEANRELGSSLNVPTGYKVERAVWRAATPGEPGLPIGGAESSIPDWARKIIEPFTGIIKQVAEGFKRLLDSLNSTARELAGPFIDLVLAVADTFGQALSDVADWVSSTLLPDLKAFITSLGTWWREDVDPFLKSDVFPTLGRWLTSLYNIISMYIMPILQKMWDWLRYDVWSRISAFGDKIIDFLDRLGQWILKNWDTIERILDRILDRWIKNMEKQLDQIDFYLSLFENMPAWLQNAVARWVIGGLGIPGFQEGGIVPGAPGEPQVILAHGGELVIPPSKITQPAFATGTGQLVIHTHVYLRDREIAEAVNAVNRDTLGRKTGSTGGWRY